MKAVIDTNVLVYDTFDERLRNRAKLKSVEGIS